VSFCLDIVDFVVVLFLYLVKLLSFATSFSCYHAVMVNKDEYIHRVRKKGATLFLPVTPRNSNRYSKFFYHHALQ